MPSFTPPDPNRLPVFCVQLLGSFPDSGSGRRLVHKHVQKVANALSHHVEPAVAVKLIKAAMPRRPKWAREVEESVEKAFARIPGQPAVAAATVKLETPSPEEIELVRRLFDTGLYFEAINHAVALDRRFEAEAEASQADPECLDALNHFRLYPEFLCAGRALLKQLDRIPKPLLELAFECVQTRLVLRVLREFKRKFVDPPAQKGNL
jgi:hypothetical protein